MERFQGLLGVAAIFALVILISRHRSAIKWRTLGVGLLVQVAFAFLVLSGNRGSRP